MNVNDLARNSETEMMSLLLEDHTRYHDVAARLSVGDLLVPWNRNLWALLGELAEAGERWDPGVILVEIQRRGSESFGGVGHVLGTLKPASAGEGLDYYVRAVQRAAHVRQLREILLTGVEAIEQDADPTTIVATIERGMMGLSRPEVEQGWVPLDRVIGRVLSSVEERDRAGTEILGLRTGLGDLDARIGGLRRKDLIILGARPSMGKAQPLDAPVLTPGGFVPMGSLRVGDMIIGVDGEAHPVVGVYPQGRRPVFRVTTRDGGQTECCDEHLWFTQTRREFRAGLPGSVKPLSEVRATLAIEDGQRADHRLPVVSPVQFAERPAPTVDPYLMGLLLGDGSLRSEALLLHNPEPDIQRAAARALSGGDVLRVKKDGITCTITKGYVGSNVPCATIVALRGYGLTGRHSWDKFIPEDYLLGSVDTRLDVLRGLFDTDGCVNMSGQSVEYTTASDALRDGVLMLVRSLGGIVSCKTRIPHFRYKGERKQGRPSHRMVAWFPNGIVPVSSVKHLMKWRSGKPGDFNHRVIVSVDPAGEKECQCIAVDAPGNLYVTSDFIVTHNTACLLQATLNIGRQGVGVGIFSMEMGGESLGQRLMSNSASVSGDRFLSSLPNLPERRRLTEAADDLGRLPVWIDDRAGLSIGELRMRARRLAQQQPSLGLICVDYLQLASAPEKKGMSREQEISQVSRGLKQIAKELDMPVLALAQLSRGLESRPIKERRPQNSDLRDSGQIEQDADVILFLFREEVYDPMTTEKGIAEINVTKCRAGRLGCTKLAWTGEYQRFMPLEDRHEASSWSRGGMRGGEEGEF